MTIKAMHRMPPFERKFSWDKHELKTIGPARRRMV